MSALEQLYLGLVLFAFVVFIATVFSLATLDTKSRRKAGHTAVRR